MISMNDGILFFPHEVVPADSIKLVRAKYGIAGYGIIYMLYERIFSLGYYTPWNEDICALFAEECHLAPEKVQPVVDYAIFKAVFDNELYKKYSILTSADIQSKFFFAARKRDKLKVNNNYLLVDLAQIMPSGYASEPAGKGKVKNDNLFSLYLNARSEDKCEEFIIQNDIFKPWLEQFEYMVIVYAFAICVRKNKKNLDYLFGILGNWKKSGYTSLDDIDDPILSVPEFLGDCPEYLHTSHRNF